MSVAAARTAPTKSTTVMGFKPSVIIGLLLRCDWTRRLQGVGSIADQRPRARATPVPGAPIDVGLVPAGQEAMHDDATVFRIQLRDGVEHGRDRIATHRHAVLRLD